MAWISRMMFWALVPTARALAFAVTDDLEPYFAGYRRLVLGFLMPWSR